VEYEIVPDKKDISTMKEIFVYRNAFFIQALFTKAAAVIVCCIVLVKSGVLKSLQLKECDRAGTIS
jgi:hypothetical protein